MDHGGRIPDLSAAVDDLEERVGGRVERGGKHVGFGTHNALLALGAGTYLEIIAPDLEQPSPSTPRPFGLDGITDAGLAGRDQDSLRTSRPRTAFAKPAMEHQSRRHF